ncbi:hypothetical protein F4779DRAFT_636037 [Xylariaceae sp. FL0662B]|nr:hypothetical protein F4779DRAFT_636037 [Xylariaceae sp. FL0662B]
MASHNSANNGATQYNVGFQLARTNHYHLHLVSQTTTVATAQRFGSPLDTRYSYYPLQELIQATNQGDITAKRYHGEGIYKKMKGVIINAFGYTEEKMMEDIVAKHGENPTHLSTVIVCLSVALSKTSLCRVLASAIMLHSYNKLDKSMEGNFLVVQAQIDKYANSVLSRDGMCNKLENAKLKAANLIKDLVPSRIRCHTLFLPPRLLPEEGDFVEFIVRLWSAQVDGEKIYVRSTKLLALALLLSEYGWTIDIFVEDDDLEIVPIKSDIGALSIICGSAMAEDHDREYVENHMRYVPIRRQQFHPTAVCPLLHIGEVTGRSFSNSEDNQHSFMLGYNAARRFCDLFVDFTIKVLPSGNIKLEIVSRGLQPTTSYYGSFERVLNRYVPTTMPAVFKELLAAALYQEFPEYDWTILDKDIMKQLNPEAVFTYTLEHFKGNSEMLWSLIGTLIGALDTIILLLVNLPDECRVRIPVGESLNWFVSTCSRHINSLTSSDEAQGLVSGHVVELCAARLTGLQPSITPRGLSVLSDIIGHWNTQQGIILTSIFERKLYHDLPKEKSKPLTFYNVPIMGIPTDGDGWIQTGYVEEPISRFRHTFGSVSSMPCDVVMEYRPNFEQNPTTVVAGVYVGGVFCHLLKLSNTLSPEWHTSSRCEHSPLPGELPTTVHRITIDSFEPGESHIPRDGEIAVVGPHFSETSRVYSSILYKSLRPVLQYGCITCALKKAERKKSCIIIAPFNGAVLT